MSNNMDQNQLNMQIRHDHMERINAVSPTFCTAKWLQQTLYLFNGYTHSCHHPSPHKIPLDELQANTSALHNTKHLKEQRRLMLSGERPSECDYCWNFEDQGSLSDRFYKSTDQTWSVDYIDKVVKSGCEKDFTPSYLEVAFDYKCNFKCAYCGPDVSSKWMEEIKAFGPYPTSHNHADIAWLDSVGKTPIPSKKPNPYIDAFWDWFPKVYPELKVFRITGGEPLLSKETWKVFEYIEQNPRKDLVIAINSNMDVPASLIDRLIEWNIRLEPHVQDFELYTSCEAAGPQAEYIRHGLNYDRFIGNINKYLQATSEKQTLRFMTTFGVLSFPSFTQFLKDVWALRDQHNITDAHSRVKVMFNYLRYPTFLDMRILPDHLREKFSEQILDFVRNSHQINGPSPRARFYLEEIDRAERMLKLAKEKPSDLTTRLIDFQIFINEHDRRRSTDFRKVFPELQELVDNA